MKTSDFATAKSDRIDTTVTPVACQRGEQTDCVRIAANYIVKEFPGAIILGVWSAHERDSSGNPVYVVEWDDSNVAEDDLI